MIFTVLGSDDKYICVYFVYLIIYILCITFYCFLLSKYTYYIHILCGLVLYIFDIFSLIASFKFFEKRFFSFIIIFPIISTVILLIFQYSWIKDSLKTFKFSTIGLSEIIYLIITITLSMSRARDYVQEALILDLAIFTPFALYVVGQNCG